MPQIGGKPKVSKATKAQKKKSSSLTSKRHFTVVIGSKEHGLYISSSPSSAARKAVSKLCATDKKRKVSFHIREITQKSEKKNYGPYLGYIEKLAKPIELKGRVIKYKPVAKLSEKTGKKTTFKKGGMWGGENGNNTYQMEKIYTLEELIKLQDYVNKFDIKKSSERSNRNIRSIKISLLEDIEINILRLQHKKPNNKTVSPNFIVKYEHAEDSGWYVQFIIKDKNGEIIYIGSISNQFIGFRTNNKPIKYNTLLNILFVSNSQNKDLDKASIIPLLNDLPDNIDGIIVKPINENDENFYKKLGFRSQHQESTFHDFGYYILTRS